MSSGVAIPDAEIRLMTSTDLEMKQIGSGIENSAVPTLMQSGKVVAQAADTGALSRIVSRSAAVCLV